MSRRCSSRRRSRTRKRLARSLSDDEEVAKLRLGARPFHALVPYYMGTRVGIVADSTYREEERKLRYIGDVLEGLKTNGLISTSDPRHITEAEVRQFLAWMRRKGLNGETQLKHIQYLKGFFTFCGNYAFLDMERRGCDLPKKPHRKIRVIQKDDLEAIFAAVDGMEGWHGSIARGMTAIAMGCALRPKEFRLAHVEDLKLVRMRFFVRHPKGEGSWGAQEEVDIVRAEVVPLLMRYLNEREEHLGAIGMERSTFLFPNTWRRKDEVFTANTFNVIKSEVEEISGISFRMKDFRSTCASMTVNADLSLLPAMSRQLRHTSLTTTQRYYAEIEHESVTKQLRDAWMKNPIDMSKKGVIDVRAREGESGPGEI